MNIVSQPTVGGMVGWWGRVTVLLSLANVSLPVLAGRRAADAVPARTMTPSPLPDGHIQVALVATRGWVGTVGRGRGGRSRLVRRHSQLHLDGLAAVVRYLDGRPESVVDCRHQSRNILWTKQMSIKHVGFLWLLIFKQFTSINTRKIFSDV